MCLELSPLAWAPSPGWFLFVFFLTCWSVFDRSSPHTIPGGEAGQGSLAVFLLLALHPPFSSFVRLYLFASGPSCRLDSPISLAHFTSADHSSSWSGNGSHVLVLANFPLLCFGSPPSMIRLRVVILIGKFSPHYWHPVLLSPSKFFL